MFQPVHYIIGHYLTGIIKDICMLCIYVHSCYNNIVQSGDMNIRSKTKRL